ncbi:malonyl-CoA decarboxylase domain-containing protein [Vibrio algarum]|uniref:Malonyl-CoA decarboxylase family protein n=1 Tax=Vibrio algarum TaxID=3020714 RepID=A0ABT4YRV3_9VIBR|nr:malonyl-CoA decarboxylase family protein [Vibrio sp. KJ40-1]MDB1124210.1 malonyl-CoA decarboxylase family protein [Vibrio sp. KJ40-1]
MEVINWSTPAAILEKIIAYEAVHEIKGWDDLRLRVAEKDRRLYGFFHASMRSEPLIFVEVALTDHTPTTIESILSGERERLDPNEATTAVFYSISNCQAGLRGISFGNFLIKQVVEELKRELPNLKRFITMSPVPGLRKWVDTAPELDENTTTLIHALNEQDRDMSEEFKNQNSTQLNRLAIQYLLDAKHKKGGPFDPVSRFHLGNGAHLEQINLWANSSEKGIADSWGIMVNYEYDLKSIEKNHEAFLSEGKIKSSTTIKKLHKKH